MTRWISKKRQGFTLVELLVVIAIIGLLAAIAVPAAMRAIVSTQEATMKMEVDSLASALEQYRSKYGDYPPDGSSFAQFQQHCRKAFPQILQTEIALFAPGSPKSCAGGAAVVASDSETLVTRCMEPAEALVLFLGGLSDDPQRPFTGPGGPIADADGNPATTADMQYNPARTNAIFEFNASRLTVTTSGSFTVSNDETTFSGMGANDLLPVYLGRYGDAPYAYFNAKTYTLPLSGGGLYVNRYAHTTFGTAVPYRSDEMNTLVSPAVPFFASKSSFQVVGSGMDGKFNDIGPTTVPTFGTIQQYTSSIAMKSSDTSYDNVTDFSSTAKIGDAARAANR